MSDILKDGRRPGFYIIDNELIDRYGAKIGAYGVAVYNLLARYAGSGDTSFPSYHTIAAKLNISTRSAMRAVQTLIDNGLICRSKRTTEDKGHISNLYTLVDLKGTIYPPCDCESLASDSQSQGLVTHSHKPSDSQSPPLMTHSHTKKTQLEEDPITKTKGTKRESQRATPAPAPSAPNPPNLFGKICEVIGWDTKTLSERDRAQVAQTAGILSRAGYSVTDLDQFWDAVWKMDWRWMNKHSRPSLTQLRQEIGKLRTKIEPMPTDKPPDYTNGRRLSKVEESLAAVDRVMARLEAEEANDVSGEE